MTQVVSSISGLEIYSPSAGFAPTNSGDVSAIASAYVESGVSSKLDKSAQVVTSTASGNYLGNDCIDHINGHYIHASDAGIAYMDGNFRQLSSLPDSAAVSAIASAYQVVSATATQLYAGTAFLTGVNGAPVSASRAGQAANASMATSAYYDGTGRLISALPDSAAVSSIASSYAESAASGKADSSSLSSYALSSDVSGVIGTVSSNSASWSGGSLPISGSAGDESGIYEANYVEFTRYDTAGEPDIRTARLTPDYFSIEYTLDGDEYTSMSLTESMLNFTLPDGDRWVDAYAIDTWNSAVDTVANNSAAWGQSGIDSATVSSIASSYAESAVSSKLDSSAQVVTSTASAYYYTTGSKTGISAINGSAIIAISAGTAVIAGSALYADTAYTAYYDANGRALTSIGTASGGSVTSPSGTILVMNGNEVEGTNSAVLTASGEVEQLLSSQSYAIGPYINLLSNDTVPYTGTTLMIPLDDPAYADIRVFLSGRDTGYVYTSASGIIPSGTLTASIPMDAIVSDISASADQWISLANAQLTARKDGGIVMTGVGELAWKSAVDNVTNTVSSNSASWGQGGVDSATVSAIASAYQVVSALGYEPYEDDEENILSAVTSINGNIILADSAGYAFGARTARSTQKSDMAIFDESWRELSSLPGSAEVSAIASSYAESAVSSKQDSSAMTSYALSSDVSGTVDLVSSQSANWGGSALALSAGAGISLTMVGNTLVISTAGV